MSHLILVSQIMWGMAGSAIFILKWRFKKSSSHDTWWNRIEYHHSSDTARVWIVQLYLDRKWNYIRKVWPISHWYVMMGEWFRKVRQRFGCQSTNTLSRTATNGWFGEDVMSSFGSCAPFVGIAQYGWSDRPLAMLAVLFSQSQTVLTKLYNYIMLKDIK